MARRFTIDDWQQRLNALNQPLIIVGKTKHDKKELFNILCYKCGNSFEADRKALTTACLLRESGKCKTDWCPACNRKRSVEGLNDVATLRKDLVKYFVNKEDAKKYSIKCHAKVRLRCLECGSEKYNAVHDLCTRGFKCDYCSDTISLGNKIIRNIFKQLPIQEYKFEFFDDWTQNKRYDCYFSYENKKYLIEIDGKQHIRDTVWSTKEFQNSNDAFKDKLAKENGYELIRIPAYKSDFDYIKQNILNSNLPNIIDLGCIDWEKIHEQTITSMNVKMANYYMEHKDMMLKDIAKHFHVSEPTLRKALKKLARAGLCDYSKERAYKNAMRLYHSKKQKGA